jgi:uncharacterized protein (DUF697 family)
MDREQKKRFLKEQKLPIADAWALVAFADRINEGKYIKFPEMDQETGNVKLHPNRELIKTQVALSFPNVTLADRELGAKMAEHFQGLAFSMLGGRTNEFDQKIMNLITQEEVDANMGMAYMACLGSRYHKEIAKEQRQGILNKVIATSIHQGAVGQHLRMNVTVINKFAGKVFAGSVVRATDGTNLYFWTSSKTIDMWPDTPEEFPIVGVVKAHGQDRDGAQETRLTRVKIAI